MQVYLPDELPRQVKQEGLPVPEILQKALRVELTRREKLAAIDEYLTSLTGHSGRDAVVNRLLKGCAIDPAPSEALARRCSGRRLARVPPWTPW
jgi:hypothetical protein